MNKYMNIWINYVNIEAHARLKKYTVTVAMNMYEAMMKPRSHLRSILQNQIGSNLFYFRSLDIVTSLRNIQHKSKWRVIWLSLGLWLELGLGWKLLASFAMINIWLDNFEAWASQCLWPKLTVLHHRLLMLVLS